MGGLPTLSYKHDTAMQLRPMPAQAADTECQWHVDTAPGHSEGAWTPLGAVQQRTSLMKQDTRAQKTQSGALQCGDICTAERRHSIPTRHTLAAVLMPQLAHNLIAPGRHSAA